MKLSKNIILYLVTLIVFYIVLYYAYNDSHIFWYLYPFAILFGTAISILSSQQKDELPIWKCLLFGIGYGVILYLLIRFFYNILNFINNEFTASISKFYSTFGPSNIWHFAILIFIIIVGEELLFRGFFQQVLKDWTSPFISIVISSILFSGTYFFYGYFPLGIITFVIGLFLGIIYEWKKSMPIIIVIHEVYIVLLLLLFPFI